MTGITLTEQQQKLLDIIKAHIANHNRAPSCQQMADDMGFTSKSGVHRLLQGLEERGAIRRLPNRIRAIELLDPRRPAVPLSQAAQDVLAERQRQISAEGWTPEHDDDHGDGEIAAAAATYALAASRCFAEQQPYHQTWPWDAGWWKPTTARRDLVKAAALILAEIERLDRADARKEEHHD